MNEFSAGKPPERISEEERIFKSYVKCLKITPEDFKKVILDVGAGEAFFAKWAKDHDISSQIYSLEPRGKMSVKENALVGSVEQIPLPDECIDLVVSEAAIPHNFLGEDSVGRKVRKSFFEMLRVLKDGGEIRLAGVLKKGKYPNQRIFNRVLADLFDELQEKYNIQIEQIHNTDSDIYENGKNSQRELLAEDFLIILHKPKKEIPA